jgi:hypothetical protein
VTRILDRESLFQLHCPCESDTLLFLLIALYSAFDGGGKPNISDFLSVLGVIPID